VSIFRTDPSAFNPWPYSIIGFFVLAIVGAVVWVTFCIGHSTDLVAADYYEQEVEYQRQLDRMERTRELSGPASVSYEAGSGIIRIQLPPKHAALKPHGAIHLYRPSRAELDQIRRLEVTAAGEQLLDAQALLPGLWDVRVLWTVNGEEFFVNQKLSIAREGF